MRMLFSLLVINLPLIICCNSSFAQKKEITNNTSRNWVSLYEYNISNNGDFIWYSFWSKEQGSTLIVESSNKIWKKVLTGPSRGYFTTDSKYFITNNSKGIYILSLQNKTTQSISEAKSLEVNGFNISNWLAYRTDTGITVLNLPTRKSKIYDKGKNFRFNNNGASIIISTDTTVNLIDLKTGSEKIIFSGTGKIEHLRFNDSGDYCCFMVINDNTAIYSHSIKSGSTKLVASNVNLDKKKEVEISTQDAPWISPNGDFIFFKLKQEIKSLKQIDDVITSHVNVWSYKDRYLQAHQKSRQEETMGRRFLAFTSAKKNKIQQLETVDTALLSPPSNQYAILKTVTNENESYWAQNEFPCYEVISLKDGTRRACTKYDSKSINLQISPDEKFLISYDTLSKQYYSYELASGILRNLTSALNIPPATYENGRVKAMQYNIEGWLKNDTAVLIQDSYDIWEVDPKCERLPINLTKGYGRLNGISFRIAISKNQLPDLNYGDHILITAINNLNNFNGFYKIKLGYSTQSFNIPFDSCIYYFPNIFTHEPPKIPIKAKNKSIYVLQRQSDREAPNVVITQDFKTFKKISDLSPQKEWNWLTAELHHWQTADGNPRKGILYKPENFDPRKKYPIIFNYYQLRSNELFKFWRPSLSNGTLDIPWYVSNGYLVFIPDIHSHTAFTGKSALSSINSAVDYLKICCPFIDTTRMGLQGHSFGGYETNYIITQSSRFAAAQSSAGRSNLISSYGGLGFGNESLANITDVGQIDMGCTPWDQPYIYVSNSPIFFANRVKTPLLLMHNPADGVVSITQAIEFFSALRRLSKPVWLLEYDYSGHILDPDQPESLDFTIRQQQFFNYYLKDGPTPEWMTKGIPFANKGVLSGLNVDSTISSP